MASTWTLAQSIAILVMCLVAAVPGSLVGAWHVRRCMTPESLEDLTVLPVLLVPHVLMWAALGIVLTLIGAGIIPGPLSRDNQLIGVIVGGTPILGIWIMHSRLAELDIDSALQAGLLQLATSWAFAGAAYLVFM